jgi:hypothetical protein
MPAKKTTKKAPIRALYGPPIRDAIRRGDLKEMKALAAAARKQVSSVKAALASLEKKIGGA